MKSHNLYFLFLIIFYLYIQFISSIIVIEDLPHYGKNNIPLSIRKGECYNEKTCS